MADRQAGALAFGGSALGRKAVACKGAAGARFAAQAWQVEARIAMWCDFNVMSCLGSQATAGESQGLNNSCAPSVRSNCDAESLAVSGQADPRPARPATDGHE